MLSAEVRGSLQKRFYKKVGDYISDLGKRFENSDDAESWLANVVSYGSTARNPIKIVLSPHEKACIEDFVQTENDLFGKVMVAISVMAAELRFLMHEARQRFLDPLLHYSDAYIENPSYLSLGRFLPFLQEFSCFKSRCKEVIALVLQQLNVLAERDFASGTMVFLYECLSGLCSCLITADCIIKSNNTLRDHWTTYKASLNACSHSANMAAKVGLENADIKEIESFLMNIERDLLSGTIFLDCLSNVGRLNLTRKFLDSWSVAFQQLIADVDNPISQSQNPGKIGERVMACGSLLILHVVVTRNVDKKFLRMFLDVCKTAPIVALWQNMSICPADVVLAMIPDVGKHVDKKQLQLIQQAKEGILQARLQNLAKDVASFRVDAMEWVTRIQALAKESQPIIDEDTPRFVRSGLLLARRVQNSVVQLFHFHSILLKPLPRQTLFLIGNMLEILMVLKGCKQTYDITLSQLIDRIVQLTTNRMQNACYTLEKRLAGEKRVGALEHVDALTSLQLLQQCLVSGPMTEQRMIVLKACLGVGLSMKKWPQDELNYVQIFVPLLKDLATFHEAFDNACNMSIFYWNRQVLRPYLEEIFQNPNQSPRIFCLLAAFETSSRSLRRVRHADPDGLVKKFGQEVRSEVNECIINPLCREIEMNLRLTVHSHLSLPERNPFDAVVRDIRQIISLDAIQFLNHIICVRDEVESYLDKTFYDLTTVALHDWKTYDEMRSLALHMYGLHVMQAHLPCQTLEQGADILEIMRNINYFVSNYAYNLNNQVFVERTSNSKHLNTIGIRHIANSLRTHGIGIMNTTVNYTYQFLRNKFNLFSQFMFDEHIKSRLIKDIKIFRDMKQNDAMAKYPFERAEKFNKAIRTLGVTADGQTRLDQFRMLITYIGNAMGFVRTVRSGGLHHCSKAICFIPDLEDIESFETLAKEEEVAVNNTATKDLDDVITMLNKNLSDGTEFFKLLLEVFSGEFQNVRNRHLHNFYMIIPPLMVNFVEHAVTCKERLHKKNPSGLVLFTDDGFAMGVAYILALLGQNGLFDSLNWTDAVREKFRKDAEAAAQANRMDAQGNRSDVQSDEKLRQALKLTARRLDSYIKEFELLFYSLSSARIFFKTNPTGSVQQTSKEPPAEGNPAPTTADSSVNAINQAPVGI
ncbi:WASH complex subunit 4-like [Paramacrobiotus metropolitanus]|uniref:WASH complex subunit 4-like n=1 Tax=Paramacrobiotus metropolitanus TaxID=2943436 RepID=UPI0024465B73|nr:WASH complex subunit 4-like [Paramacrobiotus metropolitanus]